MFDNKVYEEALSYFHKNDKAFYELLKKHGHLNDAPNNSLFVTMTRCILTQWVYLRTSNKIRLKLTQNLGHNFGPAEVIDLGIDGLMKYGTERRIAERAIRFAEYCMGNSFNTIEDIFKINIKGVSTWTKNVCAVVFSLSNNYPGPPYNALTTGDPVVRKGIWSLHGIEAYDSYIEELNEKHKPWGGLLTWYLWREFNHKSIKVPNTYKLWGKSVPISKKTIEQPKKHEHDHPKIYDYFK